MRVLPAYIKDSEHMWELEHIQVKAKFIMHVFKSMQNENLRLHYLLPEAHYQRHLRQTTK